MKTIEKKYRLLENDTRTVDGKTLYRVEAIKDFGGVKKGHKGGYIESENNLSQEGNCWVDRDVTVLGNAKVYDNAEVNGAIGNIKIYNNTKIFGEAYIIGRGTISNSKIYGNAFITTNTSIKDEEITEDVDLKFMID